MLFVSRLIAGDSYGVVDTDDWSEKVMHHDMLIQAVLRSGLKVKGVEVNQRVWPWSIKDIVVQQDPRFITRRMLKMQALQGVEVRVFDGEITAIFANEAVTPDGFTLRLSDFGDRFCLDSAIRWNGCDTSKRLVIVLDDSVKLSGGLSQIKRSRVLFDITEIANKDVAESIYDVVNRSVYGKKEYIIDRTPRFLEVSEV